jgi:hypothetical protein
MTEAQNNLEKGIGAISSDTGGKAHQYRLSVVNSPLALGLLVFLLALLPRILDLDIFVGPDEIFWVRCSDNFAWALRSGNLTATYQSGQPGITLLWLELPVSNVRSEEITNIRNAEEIEETSATDIGMGILATKRRLVAAVHTCSVVLAVLLVRKIFNPTVAWIAGCLLAFDPFLLTESRAVRSEGMVTSFTMLSLLALLWFVQERRLWLAGLTGVLAGLALLSKVSAVALLPVMALSILITPPLSPRILFFPRWRSRFAALLIWGMALIATIVLLWPALWVTPLEVMNQMGAFIGLRAVEGGGGGNYSFFLGKVQPTRALSPLFYPLALLYRTGPWQWAGLIGLVAVAWRAHGWTRRWTWSLIIILAFLAIYLALISLAGLKFDRYAVPMLPVLDIIAALGLFMIWHWVVRSHPQWQPWGPLVLLVVLTSQAALVLPYHPYYYSYYNPLLGGIRQAVHVLPVGTGYEGVEKVAAYLNNLPQPERLRLATAVSSKLKPLFKGQTIAMDGQDGHWFLADYTFLYISQVQRGKHDPELVTYLQEHKPLAHSFQLAGLDYGWIYRGPGAQYYGGDTKLEGRGTLHAFDLSASQLRAGDVLRVTVYFRNEGQRETDRLYVRLVDADSYIWADGTVQPRSGFEEAFRTRKAIVEGEALLQVPVGTPPGIYVLKIGYQDRVTGEPIGEFILPAEYDDITVVLPASYPAAEAVQPPHIAHLAVQDDLKLFGYALSAEQVSPGQAMWLTLYWQALRDIQRDYVIGVRLLDTTGKEITYWLGRPVMSRYPTTKWRAGQIIQDPWKLRLPPDIFAGQYSLHAAVYDAQTGEMAETRLAEITLEHGSSEPRGAP